MRKFLVYNAVVSFLFCIFAVNLVTIDRLVLPKGCSRVRV